MTTATARADEAPPTLDDLLDVLAAVIAGRVTRNADWEYTLGTGANTRIVSDAVYALDECRLVSLDRAGMVRDTAAGRMWLAAQRGPQAGPAPVFQAAAA